MISNYIICILNFKICKIKFKIVLRLQKRKKKKMLTHELHLSVNDFK